jgi:hypothetical protein
LQNALSLSLYGQAKRERDETGDPAKPRPGGWGFRKGKFWPVECASCVAAACSEKLTYTALLLDFLIYYIIFTNVEIFHPQKKKNQRKKRISSKMLNLERNILQEKFQNQNFKIK